MSLTLTDKKYLAKHVMNWEIQPVYMDRDCDYFNSNDEDEWGRFVISDYDPTEDSPLNQEHFQNLIKNLYKLDAMAVEVILLNLKNGTLGLNLMEAYTWMNKNPKKVCKAMIKAIKRRKQLEREHKNKKD